MPPLCKGRWLGFAVTEGLLITLSYMLLPALVLLSNPSVSFADSSLYSREVARLAVTEGLSLTLNYLLLSELVLLSNPSVSFADSSRYSKCLPCAKGGGSALP